MLQLPRWRVILVIIVAIFAAVTSAPNLLPLSVRQQIPAFLPHSPMNLGLDLQGGSHLLLEIDTTGLQRGQMDSLRQQIGSALREAQPPILRSAPVVAGGEVTTKLNNPADLSRAMQTLRPIARNPDGGDDLIVFTSQPDGTITAHYTPVAVQQQARRAADQAIKVIRSRIDPNGTSEVSIVRQGDDRIVVQAPGVSDPEQLKERIGKTALMTFNLVPTNVTDPQHPPPGTMIVGPYPGVGTGGDIVESHPQFTGEHLTRARVSTDGQTGQIVIGFQLDATGTRLFCRISREHTGDRFAILLDNQVLTAPRINEPICGGSGQISGSFDAKSASDLVLMLNAGALPAPLTVIEQRTVDATLGRDAIEAGSKATLYASIAVVVFMGLAYGLFGLMAILALIVNMGMIIGAMSLGGATLTLPGIAGLVLTIGMAVDANVLIYERMREEQKHGRSPSMAIHAGFERAMVTIIDSHLTQFLAALILFQFGEGPVKGFAWTLSIGCITSVITATFVTQTLVAIWFRLTRPKQLPI
ncbi:MAG: protein translocase subunit SecD [Terricaulis sp.]